MGGGVHRPIFFVIIFMYRTTNRWLLVVLALLALGITANNYFNVVRCVAVDVFGRECILCGCTRDFFTLLRGGGELINPASPLVFAFLIIEVVVRTVFSFVNVSRAFVVSDIVLHCILGAFVLVVNIIVLVSGNP